MKRAIIIQARMGSSRLPGKVLLPIGESSPKPMILYQIERLRRSIIPTLIVATTSSSLDDELTDKAIAWGLLVYRGSEENVLERYIEAAECYSVDLIIRITADCPLIDPCIIDQALHLFKHCDYLSNTIERSYPRGLDVEIFTLAALKEAQKMAFSSGDFEHVTPVLYRSGKFRTAQFKFHQDLSGYRLCVDTAEDFELIKKILLDPSLDHPYYTLEDLLKILKTHPEWCALNQYVKQKEVF